jgi:pimeloyl-ACP methyl ester carboxylesterase
MHLILLPGMDGTASLFGPLVAQLGDASAIHPIAYPVDQALGYAQLTALVRQRLPPDAPYVILGESFSGPIAVALAADGVGQLKGLILCCTFVRNPRPKLSFLRLLGSALPMLNGPPAVLSFALLGRFATPALRASLASAVAQIQPAVMRARLMAVLGVDVSAQMAQVKVPVLYLQAQHDRVVPRHAAQHIAKIHPQTQIVSLCAPHGLLQAASADAAKAIQGFVAAL